MIEKHRLKHVIIFIQAIVLFSFFSSVDVYYMDYLGSQTSVFCTSILGKIPLVLTFL